MARRGSSTYSSDDEKAHGMRRLRSFPLLSQGQKDRRTKMVVGMSRDAAIPSWAVGDLTRESVGPNPPCPVVGSVRPD
eukprot:gene7234-biopygen4715